MKITPVGAARPGEFRFTPPARHYLLRLIALEEGEPLPPLARAEATPAGGIAPLEVSFTAKPEGLSYRWEFGDGATSAEANPTHVYRSPGLYTATLTVTGSGNRSSTAYVTVGIDERTDRPLVRVGLGGEETPVTFHGPVKRLPDGSLDLGSDEPWKWIAVGKDEKPLPALEGLRSFTLCGWAKAANLKTGSGGNRIAFNLDYNRAGFDLVHLADGRLRLAVNQWPDRVSNDSGPGRIRPGQWVFFAVTYDAGTAKDNVGWYFGGVGAPAALERRTTHAAGPVGPGSATLTIGNYNETIHRHGKDRQFRGVLRGITVHGSRFGPGGALGLERIRRIQEATAPKD
jgi:hypothetical protein